MRAPEGRWASLLGWLLDNRLVPVLSLALMVGAGLSFSPFSFGEDWWPRDPVPVDVLPDVGENQQIVFTRWPGRSPRDVEDQITYPLTTALLGLPGARAVRSASALGFSTIYVIFEDGVDEYWARSRVLEKLASLPGGTLPDGIEPTLGPDATALGQIFWYTLEGRDPEGRVVGGWDQNELRTIQDWTVRLALQSVKDVSEVASIGGFVQEYQVDVDPDALRAQGVSLTQVADAVRKSNLDVGARTLEVNGVEYLVRGVGFLEGVEDLEQAVVSSQGGTPIRVRDVAHVTLGPALRRGALDDAGAPAVGGIVVARFGANPREVIDAVKARIERLGPGLPERTLEDGTKSQVTLVPYYDRSELIDETLGTLSTALTQEILITLVVILVMLRSVASSLLVAAMLPFGVLGAFVAMKLAGVGANIMALGGIAIAIGTMVDIGIIWVENIRSKLDRVARPTPAERASLIRDAAAEVAPAVLTSVATTVVSFLPVLGLEGSELRLFGPLALTKTFAMGAALVVAILFIPAAAWWGLRPGRSAKVQLQRVVRFGLAGLAVVLLTLSWTPLGEGAGVLVNLVFVALLAVGTLVVFRGFEAIYPRLLAWVLDHKGTFAVLPLGTVVFGLAAWLGVPTLLGFLPSAALEAPGISSLARAFPGLGREYMPPFDEGSFLYMPTTMPHASMGEALDMLSEMDAAIAAIPEVDRVVGKLGRADSALDPAPISMVEAIVTYVPEYGLNTDGERVRQWRDHIRSPRDIWDEVERAGRRPGVTRAPLLMPINGRIVMLQSGMRAALGIRVQGPTLEAIEAFGLEVQSVLERRLELREGSVFADRVVGKPYLELVIDRRALGRFGLAVADVQGVLEQALGGITLTRTVEGRQRFGVRVRYMREERDSVEALARVMVPTPSGVEVPLEQLVELEYVRGPQVIKSEDTFLTSYVLFEAAEGVTESDAAEAAKAALETAVRDGRLQVPAGVSFSVAGTYENQLRSEARLRVLVPVVLVLVLILLYLQFHRVLDAIIIYSGVVVAVSGAFALLWLYGQGWFLDFSLFGASMREVFGVGTTNLSVAVWIGVIALVGIATDDGVVMSTYLGQRFREGPPRTVGEARRATLEAGMRRVRPCLMTTATTLLALLPVVTSTGRGADLMGPMALPILGGMGIELMTLFVVPLLHCMVAERALSR